jgi:hypothetical protein
MKRISGERPRPGKTIALADIIHSAVVHLQTGVDLWETTDPNDFYDAFAEWFEALEGFQAMLIETHLQYEIMTKLMRVQIPPMYDVVTIKNPYFSRQSEEALPMDELPPDDVVGDAPF